MTTNFKYSDISEEDQERIIKKAVQEANKEQKELVSKYNYKKLKERIVAHTEYGINGLTEKQAILYPQRPSLFWSRLFYYINIFLLLCVWTFSIWLIVEAQAKDNLVQVGLTSQVSLTKDNCFTTYESNKDCFDGCVFE